MIILISEVESTASGTEKIYFLKISSYKRINGCMDQKIMCFYKKSSKTDNHLNNTW